MNRWCNHCHTRETCKDYPCEACGEHLCTTCIDMEEEHACPALGRVPYPYEQDGVTLEEWRKERVYAHALNAVRGYISWDHAGAMIRDAMENYGPKT